MPAWHSERHLHILSASMCTEHALLSVCKTGPASAHGVAQAETYRRMKRATKGEWAGFHPVTNCMWVHYLADTLLKHKKLPATRAQKDALQDFR